MKAKLVSIKNYKKQSQSKSFKTFLKFCAFWVLALIVITLTIYRLIGNKAKPILNAQTPVIMESENGNTITIKADPDGYFIFLGKINGIPVKFLYDTGATSIAIPEQFANYIGLSKGKKIMEQTANGQSISYSSKLKTVQVGNIIIHNVSGLVSPGLENDVVLLGMSFLKHVKIKHENNELILTYPDT